MKKLLLKNRKGFTLIELMIVVAIIGILAAIAIPNFIRYQLRSKTAEARTNIGGIKTNQESFRASEDNYAGVVNPNPAAAPGTQKTDWLVPPCPVTCNRTMTVDCNVFECLGYRPAGLVYYQYLSPARLGDMLITAEFSVCAQADLDGDGNFGSFAYQSANATMITAGVVPCGIAACLETISPGEVQDCRPGTY